MPAIVHCTNLHRRNSHRPFRVAGLSLCAMSESANWTLIPPLHIEIPLANRTYPVQAEEVLLGSDHFLNPFTKYIEIQDRRFSHLSLALEAIKNWQGFAIRDNALNLEIVRTHDFEKGQDNAYLFDESTDDLVDCKQNKSLMPSSAPRLPRYSTQDSPSSQRVLAKFLQMSPDR